MGLKIAYKTLILQLLDVMDLEESNVCCPFLQLSDVNFEVTTAG